MNTISFSYKDLKLKNLLLEPYRIFFSSGCLYAILSIGFWFFWYYQNTHSNFQLTWNFVPSQIHAHLMLFGVVGFYVFGFSLTAFPRFVNHEHPPRSWVLFLWALLTLSQILLLTGTFADKNMFLFAAITEVLSYLLLLGTLGTYFIKAGNFGDNKQPFYILLALVFAVFSMIFFYSFLREKTAIFYSLSLQSGAYLFLLFLVISISYRIAPFFTSRVIPGYSMQRGKNFLGIVFFILLCKLTISSLGSGIFRHNSLCLLDLVLMFVLFQEWKKWFHPQILKIPLLWVIYLSLLWVLISLGFSALELLMQFKTSSDFFYFQLPAFHALFIGCFATLILGISTRVTRGHGGFPLVGDSWMIAAVFFIQVAALWRVLIPSLEIFGIHFPLPAYGAGAFWVIAFTVWGIRYLPLLMLPKKQ